MSIRIFFKRSTSNVKYFITDNDKLQGIRTWGPTKVRHKNDYSVSTIAMMYRYILLYTFSNNTLLPSLGKNSYF